MSKKLIPKKQLGSTIKRIGRQILNSPVGEFLQDFGWFKNAHNVSSMLFCVIPQTILNQEVNNE